MSRLIDTVFVFSSIIFNISVSVIYIATKFDNMLLVQMSCAVALSLIIPYIFTLLNASKPICVSCYDRLFITV
jgi:predicted MFS family arabinose efflux permease